MIPVIVLLIQGHTKTFEAGETTSVTIATPSGNLRRSGSDSRLGDSDPSPRDVGVRARGQQDHRLVVIYLCWLVALSYPAWVAHCSIIYQTDDWLWQNGEPGGVCALCTKEMFIG